MQASVVVNRIPYVTVPSPFKRTNLFRSVTSCKKLSNFKKNKSVESAFRLETVLNLDLKPYFCFDYLFLSFAKNVSGTHIRSAKSPDNVSKS